MRCLTCVASLFILSVYGNVRAETRPAPDTPKLYAHPFSEAQATTDDLQRFLRKFAVYDSVHYYQQEERMPIYHADDNSARMPNPVPPYADILTGFRFFPRLGKIYDPETGFYVDYDHSKKYRVDVKAGKLYSGNSEVAIKKIKPHSSRP